MRVFGPKKDEVTEGWRKLHNEELQHLYSSPNIMRMIRSKGERLCGLIVSVPAYRSRTCALVLPSFVGLLSQFWMTMMIMLLEQSME
jgi:hypothetical protein